MSARQHKHSDSNKAKQSKSKTAGHSKAQSRGSQERADAAYDVESAQKDKNAVPDRTAGQNGAIDAKRNDEQQYYAAGTANDPHSRTQQRIDGGDPDAGDLEEETRSSSAPFNKTYGHHR